MNNRPLRFDAIEEARRQWEAHGWPSAQAMAAVVSIMRAQQIILGRMDSVLRPMDLSFARYEALVLLYFTRKGQLPLGKMGDRLMLHPTSVTNIVDRLEQQGFVQRVRHPSDRRTILAEITPEGRQNVEAATKAAAEDNTLGIGGLSERELDAVTKLLRKVRLDAGDFPE